MSFTNLMEEENKENLKNNIKFVNDSIDLANDWETNYLI